MRWRWLTGGLAALALLVIAAPPGFAQTPREQARFGSWNVQKDGPSLEMYSANETGATVGVMCVDGQSCSVYVATRTRCENGRRYAGIVGADEGFSDHTATCRIIGDRFVYVLSDFGRAIRSLRNTRQWGLAIETSGGPAQSFRFVVSGTREAIGAMALIDGTTLRDPRSDAMF
ncbi:MAG: hypothetical protein QM674_19285 [Burkholderiaceae bacterium]